jgi:hypothetical protein
MAQTPFPRVPSFAPPAPTGAPIDPVLAQWAHQRRIEVRVGGDARAYHSWQPFQFVPPIGVVAREARATIQSAQVLIAEIVTTDDIKRALGEAQFVIALVTARAFRYRAALRPRQATGLGQSLSRGFKALDDLVSAEPKMGAPSLGDPWFEARYEVRAPTPHEGNAALPFPLRQLLVHLQFRGVIETRPGGMVVLFEGARMDPATLDRLMDLVARTLAIVV